MKKLNVGADASVRPLTQNGITLIALIITIIVMLILVGVTINVALNGGLFDKAKTAQNQTQKEAIKEQAEVAKAGAYAEAIKNNTTFGVSDAVTTIAQELGGTAKGTYVEVTTKSGIYYVVVNNELKVTVTEIEPQVVDDLIPTPDQLGDAATHDTGGDGDVYLYYSDENENVIVYEALNGPEDNKINIVEMVYNGIGYSWLCNSYSAEIHSTYTGIKVEANKWYSGDLGNPPEQYTGNDYPEFLDSLVDDAVNENGYITRIINSF